jgi:hypothetical protein
MFSVCASGHKHRQLIQGLRALLNLQLLRSAFWMAIAACIIL